MTDPAKTFEREPAGTVDPSEEARARLSSTQMAIWAGQRLSPEAPLYNMVLTFTIEGALDVPAFRRAFERLVSRSDALRTRIEERDGVPRRVTGELSGPLLETLDLSAETHPETAFASWLDRRAQAPFQLDARLFDSVLVTLATDRFVWFLNQHHLVTDGWSVTLAYRRLVELYRLEKDEVGGGGDAPEISFPQFEDYVDHERAFRDSPAFARSLRYWEGKLEEPFEPTDFYGSTLSPDAPRTERVAVELDLTRSERLKALAEAPGIRAITSDLSRFNIFLTVLFAYLYRVSGNRSLAVLTPAHNRPTPDFKNTIGVFIEIFPVHVTVEEGETLGSLLAKVRKQTQAFLAHARPGLSATTQARPYDVLLNYIHASFGDFDTFPMRSEWVHPGHGDPGHSLRLQVHDFDTSGRFVLHFDLNRGVFGEFERRAAPRHFLAVLDAVLDEMDRPLAKVDLTTEAERRDFYSEPAPEIQESSALTVVDAFERIAAEHPDAVAVACEREALTYEALERRANQLAHHLARLGAGTLDQETLVAIYLPRSPELIVAILAVLKVGSAYVPIDQGAPVARTRRLVTDSGAAIVVTNDAGATELSAVDATLVALDRDGEVIDREPAKSLDSRPEPAALAYVIYTSGSTGRPKGVMVEHRALMAYVSWARDHYLDGARLDFPLFTSVAFDLTVTSIFVPLISGGRVVIYRETGDAHDLSILRVLEEDAVDVVKMTPAHLALVRQHELRPQRLRKIIVGGEDLKSALAQSIVDRLGTHIEIDNEYGPTEATVGCIVHRYDPERDIRTSVPIGRAVAGAHIFLVDERLSPVASGIAGEIAIAGPGLARGYLGMPELTAERFVDNPYQPGTKMYLTGDLARRSPSGELVFLGRRDDQVKIRGARIELAEVEAALTSHPDVADGVVTLVETGSESGSPVRAAEPDFCVWCGLADNHPDARLDEQGVCNICRRYDRYRERTESYFRTREELRQVVEASRAQAAPGSPDCLMLLSGGKDSTYALYQMTEMGFRPLVFSLDNGYIADGAKANIRRAVEDLGLELVWGETPAMNGIFADSLARFKNVCNGCFKTIYTLAMNLARQRGIRVIVTGLSRGQIFETRLSRFYDAGIFDADTIDRRIVDARKAYHRMDDIVARSLDVELFEDDAVFDEIRFVDFYRYTDVALSEMLSFLGDRAPWIRPSDTGRSTNCLINEAGIYVHKKERGFHNYALPYSWDVRLGHKTRDAALEELDDDIDPNKVERTLREIGYASNGSTEKRLVGYFVPKTPSLKAAELRDFLATKLPGYMLPSYLVPLQSLPLAASGKLDRRALLGPVEELEREAPYQAPHNERERQLAEIWAEVLSVDRVGIHDNFIALGGDSIRNIQIVARAARIGLKLTPKQLFDHPTVSELALVSTELAPRAVVSDGPLILTPIQSWFFEKSFDRPEHWNQSVHLQARAGLDPARLSRALFSIHRNHDALRLRFDRDGSEFRPRLAEAGVETGAPTLTRFDLSSAADEIVPKAIAAALADAHGKLDLASGPVMKALLFDLGTKRPPGLAFVAHHLVVDAVSWWFLLEDLERAYDADGADVEGSSWLSWATGLQELARSDGVRAELDYWRRLTSDRSRAPRDVATPTGPPGVVRRRLSPELTRRLLRDVPPRSAARVEDVLVTALTMSSRTARPEPLRVDLEAHGRDGPAEDLAATRTVGWMTAMYPVSLTLERNEDPLSALKSVKEQLRKVPHRGMSYGLLRYLGTPEERAALSTASPSPVLFNYLGEGDPVPAGSKLFEAGGRIDLSQSPTARLSHELAVDVSVPDGSLAVCWRYHRDIHEMESIEALADGFMEALELVIDGCLKAPQGALTPSDFPQADLSQESLDDLMEEFGEPG